MGVPRLWELLAPAGRRVSLESLVHKRLAVDVSIWLVSFESLREEGKIAPKAYLRGLFRRLCKLLFWGVRPVFVFDGTAPELKKKTLELRREAKKKRSDAAFKKIAKKILEEKLKPTASSSPVNSPDSPQPKPLISSKEEIEDNQTLENQIADPYAIAEDDLNEDDAFEELHSSGLFNMVDPDVFLNLPREIQREVLQDLKVKLKDEFNRRTKELQKKSPTPTKFSEMQMQHLLSSGEFNRRTESFQKIDRQADSDFILIERNNNTSPLSKNQHFRVSPLVFDHHKFGNQQIETDSENKPPIQQKLNFEHTNPGDFFEVKINPSEIKEPTFTLFDASLFSLPSTTKPTPQEIDLTEDKVSSQVTPSNESPSEAIDLTELEELEERVQTNEDSKNYFASQIELEAQILSQSHSLKQQNRPIHSLLGEMAVECQELLMLFGIPYIFSPEEAEAQCAKLKQLSLVDGIITDDSDVLLFGGDCVYRNVFDQDKYVECYLMSEIKNLIGLDQEKLIQLAMLLGSDYTEGVRNVGIVYAMEILGTFPGPDGLVNFKKFLESEMKEDEDPKLKRLRNLKNRISFPPDFPEKRIEKAYLEPVVDASTEGFEWSAPDLEGIRKFALKHLGWQQDRVDEMLLPSIKSYHQIQEKLKSNQPTLDTFFSNPNIPTKLTSNSRIKRSIHDLLKVDTKEKAKSKPDPKKKLKKSRTM